MNEPKIDKPYIEGRVEDWKKRVSSLYSFVKDNLPAESGFRCITERSVFMHEELMQKYNVSGVDVPILDVTKNGNILVTFKPVGLWVIGANGRVDILSELGSYILVDTAETGCPSVWTVYAPTNRRKSIDFDEKFISELVK